MALALQNDKISREREKAALLTKNKQLRANLLRSISHDLRTLLTSISGNAGILLESEENIDGEKRKQLYTDIYDDSIWLINLVENLLSVTRIGDGTMKMRLSTELIDEVVAEALRHTDRRRGEHHIQVKHADTFLLVKKQNPPTVGAVLVLGLHCVNLLWRRTEERLLSRIIFRTARFLRLCCQQRRLFYMNKPLILVVEDDNAVRNLISTTLGTHNYRFQTAPTGEAAIIEAASHNPDVILLDLGLLDIDGVEIIRKIRSWVKTPIIVISARSEDTDKIDALDAGADDYLTKPFSVEQLLAKNVGKVPTHTYITKEIWGSVWDNDVASLRVFMTTLRKKMEKDTSEPNYIQTYVGIGYRMLKI